jgi:hypothetical protein
MTLANVVQSNVGVINVTSVDIDGTSEIMIDGGSVSIDGTNDSNITVTGSAKDLDIAVVGGSTQELRLASAGTGSNAISLQATAGGITLDAPSGVIIGPESVTAPAKILFKENSENGQHAISLVGQESVADITVLLPATAGTLALTSAISNIDNTSDAAKPVSTAQQTALDLKANLVSPTFTGVPAAPTAAAGTDTTQVATTAFVKAAIPSATVATNIALHDQGTDTSCHVVFSSDKAPLEDDITVNKATYANNSITRAIYDDSGPGYKSQVLFPVSSPGYARIDFSRAHNSTLFAGLVLNTYSPVASDTTTGYSDLYSLNLKADGSVRIYHEDGIQGSGATYTTWLSTDVFSVVYDGGHGSSTSGTIMFMKNGVDLGAKKTGLASDLIFHAKFEDYWQSGDDSAIVIIDNISFHAAPTVHTSEDLIYNSSTGELAATSFTGTSLKHNSLVIGGASQNNTIDFGTDDVILFDIDNTEVFRVDAAGVDVIGAITATGDITAYSSDKRLKTNIEIINDPLSKINKLSGFTYDWARDKCIIAGFDANDEKQIGVFAQDVQSVIPEAVKLAPFDRDDNGNSKSGDNYLTVQYEKIVPLLIESIKEQQKQINELRNEVELLKK